MSDEDILARGGTEEDIAMYAHDVGKACMYPDYPCEICEAREKAKAWGRKKFLGIRLSTADVKKAIYERDAEYFKDALLSRLKEGAIQANHFNWRCVSERIEDLGSSIVLLFEELPDSHPEGVIGHQINRLLEASGEEEK